MNSVLSLFPCLSVLACALSLAVHRSATPPRRKPAISPSQLFHHSGNLRQPNQRPRPPNLPRHDKHRVRTSILASVRKQEAQLAQQLRLRQTQQRPNPRILQWRHRQPTPLQNRQKPPRRPRAKSALRVKKQPTPCVPPFPVRKLRCQRNHVLLVEQPFLAVLSRLSLGLLRALCVRSQ